MTAFLRALLATLVFFCVGFRVLASTSSVLVLSNGDRITGREVKREGGEIYFQSDLLGQIRIGEDKATVVEPTTAADLELQLATTGAPSAGFPDQRQAKPKPEETGIPPPVTIVAQQPEKSHRVPEQASLMRQLEFGLTSQSGRRDRTDLSFRANLERKTRLSELRLQGRYLYGEADSRRTTDSLYSSLRYRRDLSPAVFAQTESKYERDLIKDILHDYTQSLGMGRNVIERTGLKLAVGGGTAARYRDTRIEDGSWVFQIDAFQDLIYTINSHFKITQDMSLRMTPSDADGYLVRLNTALTSKLTNTLNMSMRYEFEYDRSLLPDARENQRIVTSVGYAF